MTQTRKKIRLWTIQSSHALTHLIATGNLRAVPEPLPSFPWDLAYKWMSLQMKEHGIQIETEYPLWAWYSPSTNHTPLVFQTIGALCSDHELDQGRILIEIDYEAKNALLSYYNEWNTLIDILYEGLGPLKVPSDIDQVSTPLFCKSNLPEIGHDIHDNFDEIQEIQAAISEIKMTQVMRIAQITKHRGRIQIKEMQDWNTKGR